MLTLLGRGLDGGANSLQATFLAAFASGASASRPMEKDCNFFPLSANNREAIAEVNEESNPPERLDPTGTSERNLNFTDSFNSSKNISEAYSKVPLNAGASKSISQYFVITISPVTDTVM